MPLKHESSLYHEFTREDAIRLVAGVQPPRLVCDGQWAIFPDTAVCLSVVGDAPSRSHFEAGSSFCWVADRPYRVRDDENVTFVPDEAVRGASDGRPIHLFARVAASPRFVYLGELEPAGRFRMGSPENHGEAYFTLQPTLPSSVWESFGLKVVHAVPESALDSQLARLAHRTTLDERFDILRSVVEYWHGEIRPGDGIPEGELRDIHMPDALRRWFAWAGNRKEIMSGQNWLLEPSKLKADKKALIFYGENQWCYEWATSVRGKDPPVIGRCSDPDPWEPQGLRVSEHLILTCLFEAMMCHAKYGASSAWLEEPKVEWLRERIAPVPLSPWTWCGETRFFASDGRFMFTMGNGENDGVTGYSVWIGAKTEYPLNPLKEIVDGTWEYVSL